MEPFPDRPADINSLEGLRLGLFRLIESRDVRSVCLRTGLSLGTVSRLRTGPQVPSRETVLAIASAYVPAQLGEWAACYERLGGSTRRRRRRASPAGATSTPYELPADVAGFVGRRRELDDLDRQVTAARRNAAVPTVVVVSGTPGVGKTAFAVHWAHRVARRFPDGCLYINLRGYGSDEPIEPAAALAVLLRGLRVADADIPTGVGERTTRFRTLLSRRRLLLVLDNASNDAQIRPLLPGTRATFTVVTGRAGLGSLRDVDGAGVLDLAVLEPAESVQLLRSLLGRAVDNAPDAAAAVVGYCAGLPLALRLAAGQALDRHGGLPAVAAALSKDLSLAAFDSDTDPRNVLRAVISWSYQRLDPAVAHTFRLLAIGSTRTWDEYSVAAVGGVVVAAARGDLDALARARVVQRDAAGRYSLHDPLRAFAAEAALQEETASDRDEAFARLLRYYLTAARRAVALLLGRAAPPPGAFAGELTPLESADQALAWLDAERTNLVAAVERAAPRPGPGWAPLLADALWEYLHHSARYVDAAAVHGFAAAAARTAGDLGAEASALEHLGIAQLMTGGYDDALASFGAAGAAFRQVGDRAGEGRTFGATGTVHARKGAHEVAVGWLERALAVAREVRDLTAQSNALTNIGLVYQRWGRFRAASEPLRAALELAQVVGDQPRRAVILNNLSLVQQRLGDLTEARRSVDEALRIAASVGAANVLAEGFDTLGTLLLREGAAGQALAYFEQALAMHRRVGDRAAAAEALDNVGATLGRLGRHDEAIASHHQALSIAEDLGDRGRVASALIGCGREARALGDPVAAEDWYRRAEKAASAVDNAEQGAAALAGLAALRADAGDPAGARRLREAALARYPDFDGG